MAQPNPVPTADDDTTPAPPLPADERKLYGVVFQIWVVLFLLTLAAGLLNYVFGFATLLWN
jgi:hypothetical protein